MPRNSAGNYTLPAGNPVTGGTTIATGWANSTMTDLGNEIQNSLDRNGRGGMLVPFQNVDGTVLEPGITFTNEPGSGIYRAGSNDIRFSVGGEDAFRVIDDTATPAGQRRPAEFWNGLAWVPAGAYDSTNVDITGGTIDNVTITSSAFNGDTIDESDITGGTIDDADITNGTINAFNVSDLEDTVITPKQTSVTDTTTGALLINGAHGLGTLSAPLLISDFEDAAEINNLPSGFYVADGSTAGRPGDTGLYDVIITKQTTNYTLLILHARGTNRLFLGSMFTNGSFSGWQTYAGTGFSNTWEANQTLATGVLLSFSTAGRLTGSSSNVFFDTNATSSDIFYRTSATNMFQMDMGNGSFHADGDVVAFSTSVGSDIRYKENIRAVASEEAQRIMDAFKGKRYYNKKLRRDDSGIIAQQVPEAARHLVTEQRDLNGNQPRLHFNYNGLWAYMIEARKQDNQGHKARADALQEQVNTLESRLATLEAKL